MSSTIGQLEDKVSWLEMQLDELLNTLQQDILKTDDPPWFDLASGDESNAQSLPLAITQADTTHINVSGGGLWRNGIYMVVDAMSSAEVTATGYVVITLTRTGSPAYDADVYPTVSTMSFITADLYTPGGTGDDVFSTNTKYCIGKVTFAAGAISGIEQYRVGYIDADKDVPDNSTIERRPYDDVNRYKLQLFDVDSIATGVTGMPYFTGGTATLQWAVPDRMIVAPVQNSLEIKGGYLQLYGFELPVTPDAEELVVRSFDNVGGTRTIIYKTYEEFFATEAVLQIFSDWFASQVHNELAQRDAYDCHDKYWTQYGTSPYGTYTVNYGQSIGDQSAALAIHLTNKQLMVNTDVNLDWSNKNLQAAGVVKADWGSSLLKTGAAGVEKTTVDWANLHLNLVTEKLSVDWADHMLYKQVGASDIPTVDWSTMALYSSSTEASLLSLDWENRYLYSENGTTVVLDWGDDTTRYMYGIWFLKSAVGGSDILQLGGSYDVDAKSASGINTAGYYAVGGNNVVVARQSAIADATDAASAITQLNLLLTACRTHGLIAV